MKLKYRGTTRWRYYLPIETMGLGLRSVKVECLIALTKLYISTNNGSQVRQIYKLYDAKKPKRQRIEEQIYDLSKEYDITIEEISNIINGEKDITEEVM